MITAAASHGADVPDEVKVLANAQGARGQTLTFVGIGAVLVGAGAAAFTLYKGCLSRSPANSDRDRPARRGAGRDL